jgi:hypothetical protein
MLEGTRPLRLNLHRRRGRRRWYRSVARLQVGDPDAATLYRRRHRTIDLCVGSSEVLKSENVFCRAETTEHVVRSDGAAHRGARQPG